VDNTLLARLRVETARADLSLWDIGGQPLSFQLRFRSRQDDRARSLTSLQPTSERRDRLYEASFRYQPSSDRYSMEAGRIASSSFVGLGYLDGALARVRLAAPLQVGVFFGRPAEIEASASRARARRRWPLTPPGLVWAPPKRGGTGAETEAGAEPKCGLETHPARAGSFFRDRADWADWREQLARADLNLTASLAYLAPRPKPCCPTTARTTAPVRTARFPGVLRRPDAPGLREL
jgi:hypothetical protein